MRHENKKLTIVGTGLPAAGPAVAIKDLTDACVFIDGTDDAGAAADVFSVKVQGKVEGADGETSDVWIDLTGAIAASTMVPLDRAATTDLGCFSIPWTHVRIHSTTIGAKAPRARVVGRNHRTS